VDREKHFAYLITFPLALNLLPYILAVYFERGRLSDLWIAGRPFFLGFNMFIALLFFTGVVAYYYFYKSKRAEALVVNFLMLSTVPLHLMALGVSIFILKSLFFTAITVFIFLFAVSNARRANAFIGGELLEEYAQEVVLVSKFKTKYIHGAEVKDPLLAVKAAGRVRYLTEFSLAIPLIFLMLVVWPIVFTDDSFQDNVPVGTLFWLMYIIFGLMLRGFGLNQAWLLYRVLRLVRSPEWYKK